MEQTFTVGNTPSVAITQLRGNLVIRPWRERQISVVTEGTIARLYQEGETVFVMGGESDVTVWIPNTRPGLRAIVTNVSVNDVEGRAYIEGAGNVELANVRGGVELVRVEGNLSARDLPSVTERRGIGGNAGIENVSGVELSAIGGNASFKRVEIVTTGAVGGNVEAEAVGARLHCAAIGGNCSIEQSAQAEIAVNNVGGNLQMSGVASMRFCNVGGNLQLDGVLPVGSTVRALVGGNAIVTLPERANLRIQAIVGGRASGEALGTVKGGNFLNVTYGDGAAQLKLTVGGSLRLLGNAIPSSSGLNAFFENFGLEDFGFTSGMGDLGREMAQFGREMGKMGRDIFSSVMGSRFTPFTEHMQEERQPRGKSSDPASRAKRRETILRMVAEGRITPEEANQLLEAIDE